MKLDDFEKMRSKKKDCRDEKISRCRKKRVHTEEMTMRKRKREKFKLVKELKKTSKSKRFYRRRLQNSFVSVFSASQMKKTALETEESIL
jgi:hypothetical protein